MIQIEIKGAPIGTSQLIQTSSETVTAWLTDLRFYSDETLANELFPSSGFVTLQYNNGTGVWRNFESGIIDLSNGIAINPRATGDRVLFVRALFTGLDAVPYCRIKMQCDTDVDASLGKQLITQERVKTASMSAADVAALNSTLYSFSAPYTLAAGESFAYNVQLSGEVLVYSIQADGLLIDVHNEESTGVQIDVYKAFNHNLVDDGNFTAFMQKVLDYQVNGFTIKSCASSCSLSVVSDINHPFSFTITNKTDAESSGFVSLTLEATGDFVFPYGLTADTQLTAATEMIQYA